MKAALARVGQGAAFALLACADWIARTIFRRAYFYIRDESRTESLLCLTGEGSLVPREAIAEWSNKQCREAEEWAAAVHLHASDNDDVKVPPVPAHVTRYCTEEHRRRRDLEEEQFWNTLSKRRTNEKDSTHNG